MSRQPRCDRFEREGLLLLEQGRPLPEHMLRECADCAAAREAHEQLRQRLASGGEPASPAVGWQARVRARIAQADAAREPAGALRRRRWLAPAFATSTAVLLVVVIGAGFFVRHQLQKQRALEAENAELRDRIDQTLERIRHNDDETQRLMAALGREHDELKRQGLQAQIAAKKLLAEAEKASLAGLQKLGRGGGAKLDLKSAIQGIKGKKAASGPVPRRASCDPNDPLCGL